MGKSNENCFGLKKTKASHDGKRESSVDKKTKETKRAPKIRGCECEREERIPPFHQMYFKFKNAASIVLVKFRILISI